MWFYRSAKIHVKKMKGEKSGIYAIGAAGLVNMTLR